MSVVDRRARQLLVTALLEQIEEGRAELLRRRAFGATREGVRNIEAELESTRQRLAELTMH
jgi:hypothetical protein